MVESSSSIRKEEIWEGFADRPDKKNYRDKRGRRGNKKIWPWRSPGWLVHQNILKERYQKQVLKKKNAGSGPAVIASDSTITSSIEHNTFKNDDASVSDSDNTSGLGLPAPHDEIPAEHADNNISGATDSPNTHSDANDNHDNIKVDASSSDEHSKFARVAHTTSTKKRACNEDSEPETSAKNPKKIRKGLNGEKQIGNHTQPGPSRLKYCTERYEKYNWLSHKNLPLQAPRYRGSYKVYDGFKLLTGEPPAKFLIAETPYNSVRLDDKWIGLVSGYFNLTILSEKWPSEFDNHGMLRAVRMPLGDPCLVWVRRGQVDIDGKAAPRDGCYYGWYRGLQLMCGNEGLDQGLYRIRPSGENPKCKGIAFKVSHPAPGEKKDALLQAKSVFGGVAQVIAKHDYTLGER